MTCPLFLQIEVYQPNKNRSQFVIFKSKKNEKG
jgi:hypothetical protein